MSVAKARLYRGLFQITLGILLMLCCYTLVLQTQNNDLRDELIATREQVTEVTQTASDTMEYVGRVSVPKTQEPNTVMAKVTGYCPCEKCCGKYADGRTSWWGGESKGYASRPGAAVDPNAVPYGSWITIPGVPDPVQADDTGGAMRQSAKNGVLHIDLRFQSHQEARKWGVQELPVVINR